MLHYPRIERDADDGAFIAYMQRRAARLGCVLVVGGVALALVVMAAWRAA